MPGSDRTGEKLLLVTIYSLFGAQLIVYSRSEFISGWVVGTATALAIASIIC
jgi:hypothetical protein